MSKITLVVIILVLFTPVIASAQPEPRIGARMIYEPVGQRIILYGGAIWEDSYTFYIDLWSHEYETNTWTQLDTTNAPPGRFNSRMTYIHTRKTPTILIRRFNTKR